MRNTLLIWIPSIQKHLRFSELSNSQYRVILKNLADDSDINFIYNLNAIIKENLVDPFDTNLLTTIDRFIIMTYFKIHSIGKDLQLRRKCHKCSAETSLFLDLENMLIFLSDKIDKSFKHQLFVNDYPIGIVCDIPSIQREYNNIIMGADINIDTKTTEYRLHRHLTSFISGVVISGQERLLANMSISDQYELLKKIPHMVMEHIDFEYIRKIYNVFNDVVFFKFQCDKCSEEFELKLQADNINEITKLIFRDNSLDMFLGEYFRAAHHSHLDGQFLDTLSYSEIKILTQFIPNQQSEEPANTDRSADLFSTYGDEIANMAVSPSDL